MKSELEKWSDNIEERRIIADFLEWVDGNRYVVAEWYGQEWPKLQPISHSHHALLDEFYEVDNVQLEKERRALIEEARKLNVTT